MIEDLIFVSLITSDFYYLWKTCIFNLQKLTQVSSSTNYYIINVILTVRLIGFINHLKSQSKFAPSASSEPSS